jgi:hypothetical protein
MSLFGGNADIKYPLSEFHETDFPNSMLLDLSMSIPSGFIPAMAAFRVGQGFVFISVEDRDTGIPIGCAIVQNPGLARVYPLDMSVDGFGWVVFGPRSVTGESYYFTDVVELSPETVIETIDRPDAVVLNGTVNGADMLLENILQIAAASDVIQLRIQGNDLIIERNDEVLSEQDRIDLIDSEAGVNAGVIFTIDGVQPDENGNIDIVVEGCAEPCLDTQSLTLPRSDAGAGDQTELPLDTYNPKEVVPGDPCNGSSSSSAAAEDVEPYDGCHDLEPVPIKDRRNADNRIGSVYIHPSEQTTPTESSGTA